jgi:hypothetical protein
MSAVIGSNVHQRNCALPGRKTLRVDVERFGPRQGRLDGSWCLPRLRWYWRKVLKGALRGGLRSRNLRGLSQDAADHCQGHQDESRHPHIIGLSIICVHDWRNRSPQVSGCGTGETSGPACRMEANAILTTYCLGCQLARSTQPVVAQLPLGHTSNL